MSADDGPRFSTLVTWAIALGVLVIAAIAYDAFGPDAESAGQEECFGQMTRDGYEVECEEIPPEYLFPDADLPEPRY